MENGKQAEQSRVASLLLRQVLCKQRKRKNTNGRVGGEKIFRLQRCVKEESRSVCVFRIEEEKGEEEINQGY